MSKKIRRIENLKLYIFFFNSEKLDFFPKQILGAEQQQSNVFIQNI